MTKKKPTRKKAVTSKVTGKQRVELRLEQEIFEKVKLLTDEADISVNQLMNALAEWATRHAIVGEPTFEQVEDHELIHHQPHTGALFLGRLARIEREYHGPPCRPEERPTPEQDPQSYLQVVKDKGQVYCAFDFTTRRAVVEAWELPYSS